MNFLYPTAIFILAGLCEIGGGYLIWLWLRNDQSAWLGLFGGLLLMAYGVVATFQSFPTFGRVYAAYGGVFIVLSLLWAYWSWSCLQEDKERQGNHFPGNSIF